MRSPNSAGLGNIRRLVTFAIIAASILSGVVHADPVVGILGGTFPQTPSSGDPIALSPFLRSQGIQTTILDPLDLANPELLDPAKIDILISLNAPYFPAQARQSFIGYLKAGGCFISLGGYAFDCLCERKGGQWVEMEGLGPAEYLSGKRGRPADTMRIRPDQIAIFDPTELFQRVRGVVSATDQCFLQTAVDLETPLQGFAATAMSGSNDPVFPKNYARWVSLLDAQDRYGRPRGSVLAVLFHHDGPFRGSAWAFSGVTSADLFTADSSPLRHTLLEIIQILRRRVFLIWTESSQVFYRPGATAAISARVANFGLEPFSGRLYILQSGESLGERDVLLPPGKVIDESFSIEVDRLTPGGGLYDVELLKSEARIDSIHGGIVISAQSQKRPSLQLTLSNNRFALNRRPMFLFGTNQTGMVWFSPLENPAVWRRDLRWMRDHGLQILRLLHFSPFGVRGYEGIGAHRSDQLIVPPPDRLQKETDALVHLCREERVILCLTLHDWLEEEISDAELKAQREWNRFWGNRYKDEPGIIFDIQNEPRIGTSKERGIQLLWNNYLRETYKTEEALRAAWIHSPPEAPLGLIPFADVPDEWPNVRRLDTNLFRARLLQRWIGENVQGLKEGNPQALVTVGFLPDYQSAEKLLSTDQTDFANIHYYGPLDEFPLSLKLFDRRFEGKPFSVGEFGAQDAHDGRVHGREGLFIAPSVDRYLAVGHESLGLGASFALNWCLKDIPDAIFPWGLTYPQDHVDKDWAKVYRNLAFFFSFLSPLDRTPEVFLLVPDAHRMGGQALEITKGIQTAIRWLLAEHIDFGVINEWDLDKLPPGARLLIWPIPYCPTDETCGEVHAFVHKGGHVYFSGDIAYDRNRKRTRLDRYEALGLEPPPECPPLKYPESGQTPASVTIQVVTGSVTFLPWPAELYPDRISGRLPYRDLITSASVQHVQIVPDDPDVHAFQIPDRAGKSFVFFRMADRIAPMEYEVLLDDTPAVFSLAGHRGAFFFFSPSGEVLAYEGSGDLWIGGDQWLRSSDSLMIRSLDWRPIPMSTHLVILPVEQGTLELRSRALKQPVVVVGEFRDRVWRTYETFEPFISAGVLSIPIDADRATCILMVCEKGGESRAGLVLQRRLRL